jgi:hypothetical protein
VTEKHNHSRYQLELELLQNDTSQRSVPQDDFLLASSLLEKPSETATESHIRNSKEKKTSSPHLWSPIKLMVMGQIKRKRTFFNILKSHCCTPVPDLSKIIEYEIFYRIFQSIKSNLWKKKSKKKKKKINLFLPNFPTQNLNSSKFLLFSFLSSSFLS